MEYIGHTYPMLNHGLYHTPYSGEKDGSREEKWQVEVLEEIAWYMPNGNFRGDRKTYNPGDALPVTGMSLIVLQSKKESSEDVSPEKNTKCKP